MLTIQIHQLDPATTNSSTLWDYGFAKQTTHVVFRLDWKASLLHHFYRCAGGFKPNLQATSELASIFTYCMCEGRNQVSRFECLFTAGNYYTILSDNSVMKDMHSPHTSYDDRMHLQPHISVGPGFNLLEGVEEKIPLPPLPQFSSFPLSPQNCK